MLADSGVLGEGANGFGHGGHDAVAAWDKGRGIGLNSYNRGDSCREDSQYAYHVDDD